jgi:hypothetical protein
MKWLKIRKKSTSGSGRWEYIPLYTNRINKELKEKVEDIVDEMDSDYNWSELHRGHEHSIVNTKSVPNTHIKQIFENKAEKIIRLEKEWKELSQEVGKGRKTDPDEIRLKNFKKRFEL